MLDPERLRNNREALALTADLSRREFLLETSGPQQQQKQEEHPITVHNGTSQS